MHVRLPLQVVPLQQGCPLAPQSFVQLPLTQARPPAQMLLVQQGWPSAPQPVAWQVPKTQAGVPPVHATPHWPQLFVSVRRLLSQPLVRLLSQSRKPAAQLQRPLRQVLFSVLPPDDGQLTPQALQFVFDVLVFVSQPLPTIESQFPKPALQVVIEHALPPQVPVATWSRLLQFVPHVPQLVTSVASVVSQPLLALLSQFPRPPMQTRLAQSPDAQLALVTPGRALQLLPQPPQFVAVLVMFVSQPLLLIVSQFAKFVLHDAMPQEPPEQVFVALAREHTVPQAPQFDVLVLVLMQLPEQFVVPELQVVTQDPAEHTCGFVHVRPHMPQLLLFVCVSTQTLPQSAWPLGHTHIPLEQTRPPVQIVPQPLQFAASVWVFTQLDPQAVWPLGQESTQVLPWQMRPAEQAVPQAPQFARSELVFTQLPEQFVCPVWHIRVHTPAEQTSPEAHWRLHAPQLLRSLCSEASQPLVALLSQFAKFVAQAPRAQEPVLQVAAALAKKHGRPQPPQCVVLVLVFVSQPFTASPSQLPKPAPHAPRMHTPLVQLTAALGRLHPAPHAPQFERLVFVSVSQPLPLLPSQSPVPALQVPDCVPHTPAEHRGTRPETIVVQTFPHRMQWLTDVLRFVSQPFSAMPSQSPKPLAQAPRPQRPLVQVAAALGNVQRLPHAPQLSVLVAVCVSQPLVLLLSQFAKVPVHAPSAQALPTQLAVLFAKRPAQLVPQALQFAASFVRFAQKVLLHAVCPVGQLSTQARFTQTRPAPHALPHIPQLARSLVRSRQVPVQFVRPAPQFVVHTASLHTCPGAQRVPQTPQFARSERRSTQRPPQLLWPVGQISRQVPVMHCSPAAQARPQPPQCEGLFDVSISHPSEAMLLQFAKFVLHEASAHTPFMQAGEPFG